MSGDFKVLLVYSNLMMENLVPLNISYLSACLKQRGFMVKLFDTTFYKMGIKSSDQYRVDNLQVREFDYSDYGVVYKTSDIQRDFIKEIKGFKPDLIGLSTVEPTYKAGIRLLEGISHLDIPKIVGGVYSTFSPEEVIAKDCVDMICIGEGEEAIVELCENLRNGKDSKKIMNLWVKDKGRVYKNPARPLVALDELPFPDFSIYEKERFFRPMQGKVYRMAPIEINRGCPYGCTYCCSASLAKLFKKNGNWYRQKSIKRVIEEIKYQVKKYDLQYLYFISDSFLAMNPQSFKELYEFYRTLRLPFWITTRPENLSPDKIKMLEEMNCHVITIGLESGDEDFRKKILNRYMSNDTIVAAFKMLECSSIKVSVNNIIGFPMETRAQIFKTIELNRRINADSISVFMFAPYRGTVLRDLCIKDGYIAKDALSPDHSIDYILDNPQLSKKDIRGLLRTFPLYAKLDKEFYSKIKIAESFDEKGNKAFRELGKIYTEKFLS